MTHNYPQYQQPNFGQPVPSQTAALYAPQQQMVFHFDGGAGGYLGVSILSFLIITFTLGICTPWALALEYGWVAKHTIINGRRVEFTGTGASLFGHWIKWLFLIIITLGIYSFWVVPRIWKWRIEHQRVV